MIRNAFFSTIAALLVNASAASAGSIYSQGHADFGVAFEAGALRLHFHAHAGAVVDGAPLALDAEFEPDEIVTLVGDDAKIAAPADLPFLGVLENDPIWVLPQVNTPGVPFLGLASEELSPNVWGAVSWRIVGFGGPGDFALWQIGSLGNLIPRWRTNDGLGDSFSRQAGTHDHYNFGFSKPGVYRVTIEVGTSSAAAGALTATETFTFNVGPAAAVPEPSTAVAALVGVGAIAASRRRKPSVS